jgi:methylglutaconyl-CoA hydratase
MQAAGKAASISSAAVDENSTGASAFAKQLFELNSLPCFLVGLANGSALGGGFGYLCCCDCVIARKSSFFALSEVKLGVIPATISPYVVAKIGPSNARRIFMTGEAFDVEKASHMGLVQDVANSAEELARKAQALCDTMTFAAPQAAAAAKRLVRHVQFVPITQALMDFTAEELARVRMTEESREGMAAIQAGSKPPWASRTLRFPTVSVRKP